MAFTYPSGLFTQLEFDKIIADLRSRCVGQPAKNRVENLPIMVDVQQIQSSLLAVKTFSQMVSERVEIAISEYRDLSTSWKWFDLEDSTLPIEDLLEIRNQMTMICDWYRMFTTERKADYPAVYQILRKTGPLSDQLDHLQMVFDEEGEVRDQASPELKRIRQEIQHREKGLHKAFNSALEKYRKLGYLVDNLESMRGGRRVLSVQAEHKRKIAGLILDESTTGKTVFIQPNEAIQIENELFDVRNDERREISRILKALTSSLSTHKSDLQDHQWVITEFDLIRAKSSQARRLHADLPHIVDQASLTLVEARHPLLLLKHQGDDKAVVPFDLRLDKKNQIVVISGPNAGGKSITLKAVGLLSLMCQSGLLIPADADSTVGIYHEFMGDIGDQQSIEQDLSTYTSHLQNMRIFTERASDRSLFLIDEFGSGTEPAIGGAIAEIIMLHLLQNRAQGVITTHYGNLKIVASNTVGVSNASMNFDRVALRPTYQLKNGVPGSSFAFEMANRSGLPGHLIKKARKKMGRKEGKLEYLLTSLQREKQDLAQRLENIAQQEKALDKLVKNYEQLQNELDIKRKKLRIAEKTMRLQEQSKANQSLDKIIRELREKEKLNSAKELAKELKASRKQLTDEIVHLQDEIIEQKPGKKQNEPMEVGDTVKMKIGGLTGTIDRIRKGKATIVVGNMKLDAKLTELEHSRTPIELNPAKSISTQFTLGKVHTKLDIRGLRRSESLQRIEQFIDQALIANLQTIEIIHGKGNGTLKQAVKDKLREYKQSFDAYHPAPEQGGEGVTVVTLY